MTSPVRITVTGAAGQIGYGILFRIASGQMLGASAREVAGERQRSGRGRGFACPGPVAGVAVEHQTTRAMTGFEVVALAGWHHATLAGADALPTPGHFQFEHTAQPDQDLKVVVVVAAVRGTVVAHTQVVVRCLHVTGRRGSARRVPAGPRGTSCAPWRPLRRG